MEFADATPQTPIVFLLLLGGLSLTCGDVRRDFTSGRAASLLAFLAFQFQPQARETLCDMLWPEAEPQAARNRLRVTLAELRAVLKALNAEDILVAERDFIALDSSRVETDARRFENAIKAARRSGTFENWRACAELFSAPLLPNFYDEWIAPAAAQLENEYFNALQKTLETAPAQSREAALQLALRGLQLDATREEIHRGVMQIYIARGEDNAARRQFQVLETVLREQLNAAPEAATRALLANLKSPPPAPRAEYSSPSLPRPLTKFFDRQNELQSLQNWLQGDDGEGDIRCVTLTGTGGAGKTRLAIEAARDWQNNGGEVVFVRLEGLLDAAFLEEAIWSTLAESHNASAPPQGASTLDLIAGHWKNRRALLVLDNFEHIVEDGALRLAQLLARAPQLRVLVSSRQRLHLAGEREIAVPALSFPSDETDFSNAQNHAGVQMFCDRAQSAAPEWKLSPRNVEVVSKLCARLDGLPLAIELVAARAGVLAPAQMLSKLEERLDLEAKAPPNFSSAKPERHRTLRAALEWSADLLSPEVRAFFASLAVFRGGWDVESCEAICRESRALHFLSQLRAASLVVPHEGGGAMRFRFLESLRILAREQLSTREYSARARRHAAYFVELSERAAPLLAREGGDDCLQLLLAEQDNFRAALSWSLENEPLWALRIAIALSNFWDIKTHNAEGSDWIERALSTPAVAQGAPSQGDELLQARALEASARLAMRTQNYEIAYQRAQAACEALRALHDTQTLAHALCTLGLVCLIRTEFERTRGLYQEALELARQSNDEPFISYLLNASIQLMGSVGDFDAALPLASESVAMCRKSGSDAALLIALVTLAQTHEEKGELEDGQKFLDELMPLAMASGPTWDHSRALWVAGNLAHKRGARDLKAQPEKAREDFRKARDYAVASLQMLTQERYDPMPVAIVMTDCALGLLSGGRAAEAASTLGAADAIREEHKLPVLPMHAARYEKALRDAKKILGKSQYEKCHARGLQFSPSQCVQFLQSLSF